MLWQAIKHIPAQLVNLVFTLCLSQERAARAGPPRAKAMG